MAKNKKTRKVTLKKNQTVKRMQGMSCVPKANRKYKDTVFRMLFLDKKNLLSLYNAINKSTYNPNMPLRDLLYISAEYQKIVDHKSLYSSVLQKIPAPYFIVFYNGTEKEEDRWETSLSEAYQNLRGEPKLELKVISLNVNEGHNKELMEQCRILGEYARYVGKVRKYRKEMELEAAVERAVDECIREGILKEFLQKNRAEVLKVSIFEYDKEEEEKKLRKAEFEAGYDTGKLDERSKIIQSMLKAGEMVEKVAEYTGCTAEEIEKIRRESWRKA